MTLGYEISGNSFLRFSYTLSVLSGLWSNCSLLYILRNYKTVFFLEEEK